MYKVNKTKIIIRFCLQFSTIEFKYMCIITKPYKSNIQFVTNLSLYHAYVGLIMQMSFKLFYSDSHL